MMMPLFKYLIDGIKDLIALLAGLGVAVVSIVFAVFIIALAIFLPASPVIAIFYMIGVFN
jgi:hypothetical protein